MDFCFRCGECCRDMSGGITVTEEEKVALEVIEPFLVFEPVSKGRYKFLFSVCPFLENNKCSIYERRPTMCRMYHCGRLKPTDKKITSTEDLQTLMFINKDYDKYKHEIEDAAVEYGNKRGWRWHR